MTYSNRIYGAALIKAINSNYNADFSGQPRTLPNGIVYATDKALKYAIKNFIKENFPSEKVFYFKRFNEEFIPYSLDDAFAAAFPMHKDEKDKKIIAKDLLSCIDIRLFGATFAKKSKDNVAISIHGPVQITHGVNVWHENNFYSEQIMSPFRNPNEKNEDNTATTLGL
ncbi:MAG: type I CRISPR-associated protein Cas7, partial [Bacteroidales bacterium]